MAALQCASCGASRDPQDNFCRRCGRQITVNLPAIQERALPVESRGIPPSLIGSVAVLAIGTGLEWVARRMAVGAARAAGRALVSKTEPRSERSRATVNNEAAMIDEVLYIRQVHLRR